MDTAGPSISTSTDTTMSDQLHATTAGTNGMPPQPSLCGYSLYDYSKVQLDYAMKSNVAAERRLTKLRTIALTGLATCGALLSLVVIRGFPYQNPWVAGITMGIAIIPVCIVAYGFALIARRILKEERSKSVHNESIFHPDAWSDMDKAIQTIMGHSVDDAVKAILKETAWMKQAAKQRDEAYALALSQLVRTAKWLMALILYATIARGVAIHVNRYIAPQPNTQQPTATSPAVDQAIDGTASSNEQPAVLPAPANDEPNGTQPAHDHDTTALRPPVPSAESSSQAHGRKP